MTEPANLPLLIGELIANQKTTNDRLEKIEESLDGLKGESIARKARAGTITTIATGAGGLAGWLAANWQSFIGRH